MQYISKQRNDSVEIHCAARESGGPPYGFSLKRNFSNQQVLYLHSGDNPTFTNPADKERIRVHGELDRNMVNVTISQLQSGDTGIYNCEFFFDAKPRDRSVQGQTAFFLFVADDSNESCSCSSHESLLYAMSAAACLLLLLLVLLARAHFGRAANRQKPQPMVPIYEEMAGVRPSNRKVTSHLEEIDTSVYVGPRKENHYVNPSTAPPSQKSSPEVNRSGVHDRDVTFEGSHHALVVSS
ncbi:cd7 antigen-like [Chanos chanos]|uniref:Cd7 antigen-like n=1 Tax=Chanos chanos TaxID=29144 RepID=A0A6J2W060_CHACN|nr:uncharacterized protein LOC115819271 [Chanos chanos]